MFPWFVPTTRGGHRPFGALHAAQVRAVARAQFLWAAFPVRSGN